MEIEPRPPVVAKKLWNLIRVVFFMLRKGLTKSKLMLEFHLMLERSKLAGKSIGNLMQLHHASAFGCRSTDIAHSFVSTREYEFSCSNSPAYPFNLYKRHHHGGGHHHHHHHRRHFHKSYQYDDVSSAVQKVLEMLNNETTVESNSPLVSLPGFGKSPLVRQLRITDSPFPLKDEGDSQVDMAAEEFIKNFYKDLKQQKSMASLDSPYHTTWRRSR